MVSNMSKIFIKAEEPIGNISLLETQFTEVIKNYLLSENKECLVQPYKGSPMKIFQTGNNSDANYILKISLEQKLK
jgi:hypothetical protein